MISVLDMKFALIVARNRQKPNFLGLLFPLSCFQVAV